ncbi:MAG: UDP-N-acetylmuramoyl-L-alanyl-D-glutamate--2,6-diaminopimelate ligase [Solirubrobacteraceae bacterium]|nr:UDP-N-acetylmuramoyl-L-alanyl-D-glutamate--2,6-diaminopimelate ligase [Solirubrobacteraceae bacterium]
MRLRDLLADAGPSAAGAGDVEIARLAYDDREAGPGTLFFCVPGFTRDGHDFAPGAVARGAAALVVQRPLGLGVPEVLVADVRAAMAPAAARLHGDPTARLRMAGITGTNGKTTTAFLTRSLLEAAGLRTGLLGTVEQVVGGVAQPAVRTTPEAIDLQATFARMLEAGDAACVMEVSSHALALHRADAVHWDAAVFTNLTQDHLDFHPTMSDYFHAKRRLFTAGPRVRIAVVDDPYGRRLAGEFPGTVGVGIDSEDAALRAHDLRADAAGTTFALDGRDWRVPLPGRFNVLNALCAIAVARALSEAGDDLLREALAGAARAPGRFEPVEAGQDFTVLVDYAHTPDSLALALHAARELTAGRVLVVFGCGGDRDRGKRPQMGAIAAGASDVAIVTSDNPRSEDPAAIIAQVLGGVPADAPAQVEAIEDRADAIAAALGRAAPGDVVLIAGKGHEQGQDAGGRVLPFDDAQVARAALEALAG